MTDETFLPKSQAALVDDKGRPTREFYDFFRRLVGGLQGQIDQLRIVFDAILAAQTSIEEIAKLLGSPDGSTDNLPPLDAGLVDGIVAGPGLEVDSEDEAFPQVLLTAATIASLLLADTAVQSVEAGTNITINADDPLHPIVSSTGSSGSGAGEILVSDTHSAPPVMLTNEAETDFVYAG